MNIIIDFDSTIIGEETLEYLFAYAGADQDIQNKIAAITDAGMTGEIGFSDSLAARLGLLDLNLSQLLLASEQLAAFVSKSFKICLTELKHNDLYIVSGGFKQTLDTVLSSLGLNLNNVYGNSLLFDKQGRLTGFDSSLPLAQDQGKVKLVESLQLDGTTVVIGDGATDLEIKQAGLADSFIYYSEFVDRKSVSDQADYVAADFFDVLGVLSSL